jgi:uncharacterized protein involved in outer membrane biogenesis
MPGEAKSPSPGRWILLAAVILALLAFVLPPLVNISRYQHRIADNISRSIGRQVHISSVKLHLLPLPGFEFADFSVQEDPQFGAEPILHSSSVVADLRLSSLWRGKLECRFGARAGSSDSPCAYGAAACGQCSAVPVH